MALKSLAVRGVFVGKPQLELVVDDPREAEREASDHHVLFVSLLAACRDVALTFGYDKTANALDATWARHGRPVSPSFLRAALNPEYETRAYFRLEWVIWFARRSEDVADLVLEIVGHGRPKKSPEAELEDLKAVLRAEYPRQAEKLIRKAETT